MPHFLKISCTVKLRKTVCKTTWITSYVVSKMRPTFLDPRKLAQQDSSRLRDSFSGPNTLRYFSRLHRCEAEAICRNAEMTCVILRLHIFIVDDTETTYLYCWQYVCLSWYWLMWTPLPLFPLHNKKTTSPWPTPQLVMLVTPGQMPAVPGQVLS